MCPGWKAKVRLVRVYEVPPSQVRHAGVDVMRRLKEQMFRAASREMRDVPATPPFLALALHLFLALASTHRSASTVTGSSVTGSASTTLYSVVVQQPCDRALFFHDSIIRR